MNDFDIRPQLSKRIITSTGLLTDVAVVQRSLVVVINVLIVPKTGVVESTTAISHTCLSISFYSEPFEWLINTVVVFCMDFVSLVGPKVQVGAWPVFALAL